MDLHDYEVRKQLSIGPFNQPGFTPQLMRQIEMKVNEKRRRKRTWLIYTVSLCASFLVALLCLQAGMFGIQNESSSIQTADSVRDPQLAVQTASSNSKQVMSTALLLGLRQDHQDEHHLENSTYRTLLISDFPSTSEMVVEGDGVLVPVEQQFWRLDTESITFDSTTHHLLNAYPAQNTPLQFQITLEEASVENSIREKIMFAGNQYISIIETQINESGQESHRLKVQDIRTLQRGGDNLFHLEEEERISFQQAVGSYVQPQSDVLEEEPPTYDWGISRQSGRWTAFIQKPKSDSTEGKIYLEKSQMLLPYSVVSHDILSLPWSEIQKIEPNVVDAISSPEKDVVVIFTPNQIKVYPYNNEWDATPIASIPLLKDEKMVMVHWATGHYVEKWQEEAGMLLRSSDNE